MAIVLEDRNIICSGESRYEIAHRVLTELQDKKKLSTDCISAALQHLSCQFSNSAPWTDAYITFQQFVKSYKSITSEAFLSLNTITNDSTNNYIQLKRVLVTPSRIIPLPYIAMRKCRLLRKFASNYDFVVVRFVDENKQTIRDSEALTRIEHILHQGFEIMGVVYRFLFPTSSQSRNQSAYFVAATCNEIEQIRQSFVLKNTDISIAKYASRLALFGTADCPTIQILNSDCIEINDKYLYDKNTLLTDGAGRLGLALAQQIWSEYQKVMLGNNNNILPDLPSAFQVRFCGMKGILVVDPNISPNKLYYRKSMIKCQHDDRTLCIVKTSQYTPVYLNREIITLLESLSASTTVDTWNPCYKFTTMQEKELEKALSMLQDPNEAEGTLIKYLGPDIVPNSKSGINLLMEPMWYNLLRLIYQKTIYLLRTKTRLYVDEGCLAIGVPDEYDCLGPDQVFIQTYKNGTKHIITGSVMIYRNPCLHVGDVRVCQAVDKIELHHLLNVIVLNTASYGVPLAAACSGGDLDGDMFSVIWDQDLVPPKSAEKAPLNYDYILQRATKNKEKDISKRYSSLENFYVRIISNDTLGRISTMHLALCDIQPLGACDELAMKLAEAQSLAVDFPKTGIPPQVPKEVLTTIKNSGYPDFMEKGELSQYVSKKILGKLYRRCRSFFIDELPFTAQEIKLDVCFSSSSVLFDSFIDEAKVTYNIYISHVQRLMRQFSLRNEFELILGDCLYWDNDISADIGKSKLYLQTAWKSLQKLFRTIFFENLNDNLMRRGNKEMLWSKAAAWYHVAYKSTHKSKYLSFPWIIGDILCDMKTARMTIYKIPMSDSYYYEIGANCNNFLRHSMTELEILLSRRHRVLKLLTSTVNQYFKQYTQQIVHIPVLAYGSTSLLLCEHGSDIDIFIDITKISSDLIVTSDSVLNQSTEHIKYVLEHYISPAIEGMAFNIRKIFDTKYPIITCTMNDGDCSINADISIQSNGRQKANFILTLYQQNKSLFHCFLLLVGFARTSGIIRSALIHSNKQTEQQTDTFILKTTQFHALILGVLNLVPTTTSSQNSTCSSKKDISADVDMKLQTNNSNSNSIDYLSLITETEPSDLIQIGEMMILFFTRVKNLKNHGEWEFIWPIATHAKDTITSNDIDHIAEICEITLHSLLISRSWKFVINNNSYYTNSKKYLQLVLSSSVSNMMETTIQFHKALLEFHSGAIVTLQKSDTNNKIILTGQGSIANIRKLRNYIFSLMHDMRRSCMGFLNTRSSAYFMASSAIIFVIGYDSKDTMLTFENYMGPCQKVHKRHSRKFPIPMNKLINKPIDNNNEKWINETLIPLLYEKLMSQISNLPNQIDILKTLTISFHFGVFYCVNTEMALESNFAKMSVADLELAVSRTKSRKNPDRQEFSSENIEKMNMVHLIKKSKASSDNNYSNYSSGNNNNSTSKKHKLKKRSVGSSFYHSIFEPLSNIIPNTSGHYENDENVLLKSKQQLAILDKLLLSAGFHKVKDIQSLPTYKVTFIASTSYIIDLRLNSQLEKISMYQKPLSWLHATVISDATTPTTTNKTDSKSLNQLLPMKPHIRVKLQTMEIIEPSSDLFKLAYPNINDNDMTSPIEINNSGFAIPAVSLCTQSKNKLTFIRQLEFRSEYKKQNLIANTSFGYNLSYDNGKVIEIRPFLELSIYEESPPSIINWIKQKGSMSQIKGWVSETVNSVMSVHQLLPILVTNE